VQVFSSEREHSYLSDTEYAAMFAALIDWIDNGRKPGTAELAHRCASLLARFDSADGKNGCHLRPGWQPPPLESRVPPRVPQQH